MFVGYELTRRSWLRCINVTKYIHAIPEERVNVSYWYTDLPIAWSLFALRTHAIIEFINVVVGSRILESVRIYVKKSHTKKNKIAITREKIGISRNEAQQNGIWEQQLANIY